MKKIISILLLSVSFYSCESFLDLTPSDVLTTKNHFKTERDVNTALTGVYDVMGKTGTYGRTLYFELDMSDESFNNLGTQLIDLSLNNYDNSDSKVDNLWTLLHDGINRANMFLKHIENPDLDMDAAKKKIAIGEAKFLRSYYYFLLVSYWGDVPFRLEPIVQAEQRNLAKTPSKQIYQHIVTEMEESFGMVREITDFKYNSRVTKSVVAGILARVNLKMAGFPLKDETRYAEARRWTLEVMAPARGHELNPDYKQIFINHCQDLYDIKECIWEVEFGKTATAGQEEEGSLGAISGIGCSDREFGYSYGAVHCTERYYRLFEDGLDLRRDWAINSYYYKSTDGKVSGTTDYTLAQIYNRSNAKWRREFETAIPKNVNTTPINFPILRYADVLLMFAEAENAINHGPTADAYNAVNEVRRRGYGLLLATPPNPAADPDLAPALDESNFLDAIQKERSLELGFEAIRRHDLIRWGIYESTMRVLANEISLSAPAGYKFAGRTADNTTPRHLLLPIPSLEMALNKAIVQNEGW